MDIHNYERKYQEVLKRIKKAKISEKNINITKTEGIAIASCEKVNPKTIFSLCWSGGGISYMNRIFYR